MAEFHYPKFFFLPCRISFLLRVSIIPPFCRYIDHLTIQVQRSTSHRRVLIPSASLASIVSLHPPRRQYLIQFLQPLSALCNFTPGTIILVINNILPAPCCYALLRQLHNRGRASLPLQNFPIAFPFCETFVAFQPVTLPPFLNPFPTPNQNRFNHNNLTIQQVFWMEKTTLFTNIFPHLSIIIVPSI